MTSWIGPLSVSADAVILAALTAALARSGASQAARPVIASAAFACAWLMTAGLAAMHAPGWTVAGGAALIVVSIAAIVSTVHLWAQAGIGGQIGPGHGGADGGDGPKRRPDGPQHGGGGGAPGWWPDFERQFALYVAERERGRAVTLSARHVSWEQRPRLAEERRRPLGADV
jgi:hypothetical protein